jgi:hypothetical protein
MLHEAIHLTVSAAVGRVAGNAILAAGATAEGAAAEERRRRESAEAELASAKAEVEELVAAKAAAEEAAATHSDAAAVAKAKLDAAEATKVAAEEAAKVAAEEAAAAAAAVGDATLAAAAAAVDAIPEWLTCVENEKARDWWNTYIGERAATHSAVCDAMIGWLEREGMLPAEASIVATTTVFGMDKDADGEITVYEFAKFVKDLDDFTGETLRGADIADGHDPTQVGEYAEFLGIDVAAEPELLWIAAKCMSAPLPKGWAEYVNEDTGAPYFHHAEKNETSWDHPLDKHFRELVSAERENIPEHRAAAKIQARQRGKVARRQTAGQLVKSGSPIHLNLDDASAEPVDSAGSAERAEDVPGAGGDEMMEMDVSFDASFGEGFDAVGPPAGGNVAVARGVELTVAEARVVRELVLGEATPGHADAWEQGLEWNPAPELWYGLWQEKGGPCGVIAAVQAAVLAQLQELGSLLTPPPPEEVTALQSAALAKALAKVLWRAGGGGRAVVALRAESSGTGVGKDFERGLAAFKFTTKAELLDFLMRRGLGALTARGGAGLLLLMASALLSRGAEAVRADMDDAGGAMLGGHGYCRSALPLGGIIENQNFAITFLEDLGFSISLLCIIKSPTTAVLSVFNRPGQPTTAARSWSTCCWLVLRPPTSSTARWTSAAGQPEACSRPRRPGSSRSSRPSIRGTSRSARTTSRRADRSGWSAPSRTTLSCSAKIRPLRYRRLGPRQPSTASTSATTMN